MSKKVCVLSNLYQNSITLFGKSYMEYRKLNATIYKQNKLIQQLTKQLGEAQKDIAELTVRLNEREE